MYKVSEVFLWNHPDAVTLVPVDLTVKTITAETATVSVALGSKAITFERPGRKNGPPLVVTSKPATQEQLKWLKENEGRDHIYFDPSAKAEAKAELKAEKA